MRWTRRRDPAISAIDLLGKPDVNGPTVGFFSADRLRNVRGCAGIRPTELPRLALGLAWRDRT